MKIWPLFILLSLLFIRLNSQNIISDSLTKLILKAPNDTTKINLLVELAKELRISGQFELGISRLEEANNLAEKLNYKKGMGDANNWLGNTYVAIGNYNEALKHYKRAIILRNADKDYKALSSTFNNIANVLDILGKKRFSFNLHSATLKLKIILKDSTGIAMSYANLGNYYSSAGDYPNAIRTTLNALKIHQAQKNLQAIGNCRNGLGNIYDSQKNYEEALKEHFIALSIRKQIGDKIGMADSYNNIGIIYNTRKQLDKSLEHHLIALKIREEIGDMHGIAVSLNNIGNYYTYKSSYKEALSKYFQSMAIREKIGDTENLAASYSNLSSSYYRLQNYRESEKYCQKAVALSKELNLPEQLYISYDILSSVQEKLTNYKAALSSYKLGISYRDSVFNKENTKKLITAKMNFDFEKKEQATKLMQDKKDALSNEKIKQQTQQRNYFIIGFIAAFTLLIFIFNAYRQKKEANIIISNQKKVVEMKNEIIEEKQKEILDSINYAKRIQYTLLAHADFLNENIPNNFVFFHPKDIVSGDFYWASKRNNMFYLAVCDSTGHGVPGAFMSLLNIGFLTEAINEKGIEQPNEVFNFVRQRLIDNISKEGQKDGFDGILICIDKSKNSITYTAANNPPILIQNNSLVQLPCDRMPVGKGERKEDFKLYSVDINQGDTLYLYTDGYADQFGGPKGKKFKYKQLNELLVANCNRSLNEQNEIVKTIFDEWKGNLEQVDDVCVIGIRI